MLTDASRLLLSPSAGRPLRLSILGFWTAMGLIESSKAYVTLQLRETPRSWLDVLVGNMPWWYAWAILTPLIFILAARFRVDRRRWRLAAGVHLLAALTVSFLHLLSIGALFYYTVSRGGEFFVSVQHQVRYFADNYLAVNVLTYFAIVGAYYAIDFYVRMRTREVTSAQLEASMHEARLAALRMELNPHFLFNALNSVAGLVRRREHDAAVAALAGISDLLRRTLDTGRAHESPLSNELELARRYLAIERLRFGDRLTVKEAIDDDALDALVPTLILQPLVENAVRHGIARMPGAGSVGICARRAGSDLEITIRNTGAGFSDASQTPATPDVRTESGLGLSNTRERLGHLYGRRASLATRDASGPAGAEVAIRLPYHTEPEMVVS